MSSDAYLQQISPYLLGRFKQYPALVSLFLHAYEFKDLIKSGVASWTAIERVQDNLEEEWESVWEPTLELTDSPKTYSELRSQNFSRLTCEDWPHVESDFHLALAESRFPIFHLGTRSAVGGGYESLQIFLAGTRDDYRDFLTQQDNDLLFVNLLGAGEDIGNNFGYGKPKYCESNIVREIYGAINKISNDNFVKRWQLACKAANLKPGDISDKDFDEFIEFFRELRAFFKDTVKEGNAMLTIVG